MRNRTLRAIEVLRSRILTDTPKGCLRSCSLPARNFRSMSCCCNPTARNSCFNVVSLPELSRRTFSLTFVRIVIYAHPDTVARPRPLLMKASLTSHRWRCLSPWGCFRSTPRVSPTNPLLRPHGPLTQITTPMPRAIVVCKLAFLRSRLAWLRSP